MPVPQKPGHAFDIDPVVVPAEVTITRRVGRGVAVVLLVVGQLLSSAWMLAIEFTSGHELLGRSAFLGYLAGSVAAWSIAGRHPGRAVLVMGGMCAALLGLLLVAERNGWLGA
ncbi:MAG TPA: hypothetical protein VE824_05130 [Gaiellales bacterium]|nr:hypothetical protein [Gaiellales bacterium]